MVTRGGRRPVRDPVGQRPGPVLWRLAATGRPAVLGMSGRLLVRQRLV